MITFANAETYHELIQKDFVIVDFYSTTCGPCKMFSKILEGLTVEMPFVNIVKVNVTDHPSLGEENEIDAVPTIFFMKDGVLLEREVGTMTEEEVVEKISEYYYG